MPKNYQVEFEAFQKYIKGERIPPTMVFVLLGKSALALVEGALRNIPGVVGYRLRYHYYRFRVKSMGRNVLIDTGVVLSGCKNISIGDYTWIDANCILSGYLGEIKLGRRIHIAPFSIIGAREQVVLEDYVGISAGVKIYGGSEHPVSGKRMSGPMIPEEMKGVHSGPVILRKDSFVGTNSVILPGVEIGEGAVVGANAVITRSVRPYDIVVANGKVIGHREPVTVPEI